jgi:hypothetical protein
VGYVDLEEPSSGWLAVVIGLNVLLIFGWRHRNRKRKRVTAL